MKGHQSRFDVKREISFKAKDTNKHEKKAIPNKFPCCQVEKGGNFKLNKRDENENIQYYAGSENQIRMTRWNILVIVIVLS